MSRSCTTYLDTSVITYLNILNQFTSRYYNASTLVASNKGKLGRDGPVAIDSM